MVLLQAVLIFIIAFVPACKKCQNCVSVCKVRIPLTDTIHRIRDTICSQNYPTNIAFVNASQGDDSTDFVTIPSMEKKISSCDETPGGALCR